MRGDLGHTQQFPWLGQSKSTIETICGIRDLVGIRHVQDKYHSTISMAPVLSVLHTVFSGLSIVSNTA